MRKRDTAGRRKDSGGLRALAERLLDLFYPPRCVFCAQLLKDGEEDLCGECQKSLPWTVPEDPPKECKFLSQCVSPLWYQDTVRRSFHRYKFGGRPAYAELYGLLMAQCVRDRLEGDWDLIAWAPLSARRRKRRGYDQAELLACSMGRALGMEALPLLRKLRDTPAQSSLSGEAERRANAEGAYAVADPAAVAGRRVLLADDIVTTGSTLSQCARVLREAGAADVAGVTFARARR